MTLLSLVARGAALGALSLSALAAHGCGTPGHDGTGARPTSASAGGGAGGAGAAGGSLGTAGPEAWPVKARGVVCVTAVRTVDLGPGSQAPPPDALAGCRTWPEFSLVSPVVAGWCGPCGFTFDRPTTERERADRPDACCYAVASPPPPPPPPAP